MYPTRRRPGKHLEGFLKTLQRHSATLRDIVVASLRVSLQQLANRQWRWRGWVVLGVDGSRINCPRTNENKKALGCAGREKTGPQLLLTTVYHIATGVVWSWRRGGSEDSERAQLRDMLCELPGNTLLVADAGFVGYDIMQPFEERGAFLCHSRRVQHDVAAETGLRLRNAQEHGVPLARQPPQAAAADATLGPSGTRREEDGIADECRSQRVSRTTRLP